MLSPAPRVILFRPPLNHVTPLHKTLQAPLLTWNETQNSRNGLQGLARSRQSSAPIPFPSPLLSSPPVRSGSGLLAALRAGSLRLLTHARETPLGVFVLAVSPVICSNSWFTLSLHWGLGSNVTSSERSPLSTYLKLYEEETSPVLGISASPTPCPVPGT